MILRRRAKAKDSDDSPDVAADGFTAASNTGDDGEAGSGASDSGDPNSTGRSSGTGEISNASFTSDSSDCSASTFPCADNAARALLLPVDFRGREGLD